MCVAEDQWWWSVFPRWEKRSQWQGWCAHSVKRSGGGNRSTSRSGWSCVQLLPDHQQGGDLLKNVSKLCISDNSVSHTHLTSLHVFTQSGLLVTTVVGFIEESFCPCPNPAEVSAVFSVPLDLFTSEENHVSSSSVGTLGLLHSFYFLDPSSGNQYHIWGLTAMIAIVVSVLALGKKPEFDVAFDTDDPFLSLQKVLHRKLSKLWLQIVSQHCQY